MTFDSRAVIVFSLAAALYAGLIPAKGRAWALLVGSLAAVYWLQPPLPIRFSDYILPTLTIVLAVCGWWLTRKPGDPEQAGFAGEDRRTLIVVAALIVAMAFMRYLRPELQLTASRPPSPFMVALILCTGGLLLTGLARALAPSLANPQRRKRILSFAIITVLAIFVVLKTEPLAAAVSGWWRGLADQDISLAAMPDLAWLGFSFVAFRLIHTLRDRQTGILPALSLREYLSYIIFFPAYTAGPIDRAERFVQDFRDLPALRGLDPGRFGLGGQRILIGLFKKFVIADALAQGASLNFLNAAQANSSPALWLLLYGYGLRLYFDFAGYSDIAIGMGILFGIRLPENFNRPYWKSNIAAFWQSWHITLSNWARFYVFSPLSRTMLTRKRRPSSTVIVLLAQTATMVVIGLWHGITWNFFIWGLWHGLALFIHKQWSDRTRRWYRGLSQQPRRKQVWSAFAWLLTFQYVTLGWVWFALPSVGLSLEVFGRLFGLGLIN